VYRVTNVITNKNYIGYTSKSAHARFKEHIKKANSKSAAHFHISIKEHGEHNFNVEVLFETLIKEQAILKEIEFITKFKTLHPNGYNSTLGGEGGNTWGSTCTDQRKNALSARMSGIYNPNAYVCTDDEILQCAIQHYEKYGTWLHSEFLRISKANKYPQHLVKSRFAEFGGGSTGLKNALLIELKKRGHCIDKIVYNRTSEHSKKISAKIAGMVWVTDTVSKKSFLADKEILNKPRILKGRNKC